MIILNLIASILVLVCIAFRFYYVSLADDDTKARMFFFIVLSIYLAIFTFVQILAELKIQRVRTYVNFLDTKFGRGCFFIFLGLLVLEVKGALEIILAVIVLVIGVLNIMIGFGQGSDGKDALKLWGKKRDTAN